MRNRTYYYAGRKKKKRHVVKAVFLLLALGAGLWFWFYFKVEEVEVVGSTHYSQEQIKSIVLRGPLAENSVLAPILCSRGNTEEISFVDAVEVSRVKPHAILISVKEKQAIGCVRYLDCYIYFDRDGMAIDSSVERDADTLYFEGMEPEYVCLNQMLPVSDEHFLRAAVSLSQMIQEGSRYPDQIRFDEKFMITLTYGDVQVEMGENQYLDDKMDRMEAILPYLEEQKGTLHLENVTSEKKTITFESDGGPVRKN